MDTDKIKLPLLPVIALVMGMAGAIGTAAVSMYQLGEVREQLAEITDRAEVSAQAVMQADVQRLKGDVDKLLSLSDDNMNKIIAINARGVTKSYDDSDLRQSINRLRERVSNIRVPEGYDDTPIQLAIQDIRRDLDERKREEGRIKNNQEQLLQDIDDLFMDLDELTGRN